MPWIRAVASLVLFGISFGYVEAAVVVYLRHIYDPIRRELHPDKPPGDLFPLITAEQLNSRGADHTRLLVTELGRELATLVMLAAAALAVASNFRQWLAGFVLAFGVWDITFYGFLKLLIAWPASLFAWDILFLLPLPWVGPVIAPCIVAATMVGAGVYVLRRERGGSGFRIRRLDWILIVASGVVMMVAFMWDWRNTTAGNPPNPFNWPLFGVGELLGLAGFVRAAMRRYPAR